MNAPQHGPHRHGPAWHGPQDVDRQALPLGAAPPGHELVLAHVGGGVHCQRRLMEMGLRPGVKFRLVGASRTGPAIISMKDGRLMLGRGMIDRIWVYVC
jgi:Fe2+ transport system protein FeoA